MRQVTSFHICCANMVQVNWSCRKVSIHMRTAFRVYGIDAKRQRFYEGLHYVKLAKDGR